MKTLQNTQKQNYDAPRIKVVSFTVEQGFAGSYRSEALPLSETGRGLETVDQSSTSLTDHFQF